MALRHFIGFVIILVCSHGYAQQPPATEQCAFYKQNLFPSFKTTVAAPEEDNYDIKHVKIDVSLDNQSVAIQGSVTVHAIVLVSSMSIYSFELNEQFVIDGVSVNGISLPVTTSANNSSVRSVALPVPLLSNTSFTAVISYHGNPVPGNGYFQAGLNNTDENEYKLRATYTLSEPYMASQWWPCKQSLKDKIDSADIWITVPTGLKAGSSGLLRNITPTPGKLRYEWHTNYPIDYYLISIAVAPYQDYSFKVKINGISDSLLVQNYIYDAPGSLQQYKNGIDSTAQMLQYFSELFGPYPFYKEKYGHCIVPLPGGMEHQTMTTCGGFSANLVAHELAHQWFGDHVTCATWKDIWLNEGFASYSEYLFYKRFRPWDAERHMQIFHDKVLKEDEKKGAIYVDDTTNSYRIFDGRLSYAKAAAVIHTLRFVADNDSLFFLLLRKYQQQYAFGNATTEEFKSLAKQTLNINLDTFFSQWIYKEGYPVHSVSWNQFKNDVYIQIDQSTTVPQSVELFYSPMEIKLSAVDRDTVIRIYNNAATQLVKLKWDKTITTLVIDPANYLLNGDAGIYRNPELGLNEVSSNGFQVWPNPSTHYWCFAGLPLNSEWTLTDISGKIVQKGTNAQNNMVVYNEALSRGMYLFSLMEGKQKIRSVKLVKN